MRSKFAANPGQIERSVDLAHQMIFGNRVAKMKLVEQLTLVSDGKMSVVTLVWKKLR